MENLNRNQRLLFVKVKGLLDEATTNRSSGRYSVPLSPGLKIFDKSQLGPFTEPVSPFNNAELSYDSYDNHIDEDPSTIKKIESKSRKISIYNYENPTQNDEDGDVLNVDGSTDSIQEIESKTKFSFDKVISILYPVIIKLSKRDGINKYKIIDKIKKGDEEILKKIKSLSFGSHLRDTVDNLTDYFKKNINEDLAVWFGSKKKPKGSKQPKGPWVNICRKVNGKHPPCGRPDADTKGYPKCRAAGVAGKMTDSQKKSACAQKRRAEKKEPKYGTGNKPTMTSYKTKNESELKKLILKVLSEELSKVR